MPETILINPLNADLNPKAIFNTYYEISN